MKIMRKTVSPVIFLIKRMFSWIDFLVVYSLGKLVDINIVIRYLRNPNPLVTIRMLRSFGAKIGTGTTVKRTLFIDNAYEDENSVGDFRYINIGNNCYIGDCVYFDLANKIIMEDNVVVSGNVAFITHADCNRSKYLEQIFPRMCKPIKVNDGAWIGFGAIILSGVTIGHQSVVASKSLVLGDTEPRSLYGGSPAKKIKDLKLLIE
jgi:maltose O-acetyltransferase